MSLDRFQELVRALCTEIELLDVDAVLERRRLEVEGLHIVLDHVEEDAGAMYLQFDYGITTAGRTLRVFRMMLESNLLVYAQDQAQLSIDPNTGGALLILRVPMGDDIDGPWLAETITHYAEHGRYWRDNMSNATEEMFEGIVGGHLSWVRA